MTVTETRPDTSESVAPAAATGATSGGLLATPLRWLDTEDHKQVGRLFIVTSMLFGMLGLVLDALVRLEGADAGDYLVLDVDTFDQVLALSRDSLVLLFVLPLFLGLAAYVVPLQLGTRTIAFPRLLTASFWSYLVASGILVAGYAANGGPFGGDSDGVRLYLVALGMWSVAVTAAAVCIAASVIALRAPGMSLRNLAPFSFSAMVTSLMIVVTMPVVTALALLLYIDHRYGRLVFGGNTGIAAHLDWLFIHPQLLVLTIPTLGIVFEIVPVAARLRQVQPVAIQGAISIFGLLSFGAFANEAIVNNVLSDGSRVIVEETLYVGMAALAVLPLLACLGLVAMTARGGIGSPPLAATALAVVSLLLLLGGAFVAAAGSVVDALFADGEFELRDTTWRTGVLAVLALGGGLGGLMAGVRWWAPKIWGRTLSEPLGFLQLLTLAGGVTVAAVPAMISGAAFDQPWSSSLHDGDGASEALAAVSAAGIVLVLISVVLLLLDVLAAVAGSGDPAGADPHEGHTLEWATSSPPPPDNFVGDLPPIESDRPLLDRRERATEDGR